jgi:hypothetical protein
LRPTEHGPDRAQDSVDFVDFVEFFFICSLCFFNSFRRAGVAKNTDTIGMQAAYNIEAGEAREKNKVFRASVDFVDLADPTSSSQGRCGEKYGHNGL